MPVMTRLRKRHTEREQQERTQDVPAYETVEGTQPIGTVQWRQRVCVAGRVRSLRVQPWAGVATLEAVLVDGTGGVSVVFLGRRQIAGIRPGAQLVIDGMVGAHAGRLAILNPDYRLLVPEQ